jgi:DNA invertase Pin-like site-specific DNA recombinase
MLRGVCYWRMSSNPQEKSIPQQRAEMLPKCRLEGVEVVREFKDEGRSGGSMKKRNAFLDMVAFCQSEHEAGRPISVIVCYDTSRFSRADSSETQYYVWQFRQAGTNRILTHERWCDLRREEDRTIFNLQQDFANNRYLRDHSQRVLRGKKSAALAGFFAGGSAAYGFDRLLVDERGEVVQRFRRGEKVRLRKQGWHEILSPIPAADPDPARQLERQTALWLFETFARERVSYHRLAEQLNLRGVPPPGAPYRRPGGDVAPGVWCSIAVKRILTNAIYKGLACAGADGRGQYHRLVRGEVSPVEPGPARTYNTEGLILTPLDHGGYVSAELWDAVQAKVRERAIQKTRPRQSGYALPAGILHCGHCGHRMYGCHLRSRRRNKIYRYRKFVCSSPSSKPGTCKHYSVDEEQIVSILKEQLLKVYLAPERLAGLEAALVARAEARHDRAPADVERLKTRLAALDEDIVRARRRTLAVKDDSTFAQLNEGLRELLEQRQRLEKEQQAAAERLTVSVADETVRIDEAINRVQRLREELERATGPALGEAIRLLVTRCDLFFEERQKGKGRWFSFVKGVIKVRPFLDVSDFSTAR